MSSSTDTPVTRVTAACASESGERLIVSALMPSETAAAFFCSARRPAALDDLVGASACATTSCSCTAAGVSVTVTTAVWPAVTVMLSSCTGL